MEYADVIEKLRALPPEKQSEVVDFVEFLASRPFTEPAGEPARLPPVKDETPLTFTGPLAALRARVARRDGQAQPMSRDELHDRARYRGHPDDHQSIHADVPNPCLNHDTSIMAKSPPRLYDDAAIF